jgi:pyroglutamyl-peptidase
LPLRAIREALLARGIPARLSNSAGTYLCNAAMYRLLGRLPQDVPAGFIHLPHLPAEAARLMAEGEGDLVPSMALELQVAAVRAALALCLENQPLEHHITA